MTLLRHGDDRGLPDSVAEQFELVESGEDAR